MSRKEREAARKARRKELRGESSEENSRNLTDYRAALKKCPRKFDPFSTFKSAGIKHGLGILIFPLLCFFASYAAMFESGNRPTVAGMPKQVTGTLLILLGLAGCLYLFVRLFPRDESHIHKYLDQEAN